MPACNILILSATIYVYAILEYIIAEYTFLRKLELATVGGTTGHVTGSLLVTKRTNNKPSAVTYNVTRTKIIVRSCQS
jgi:hypothetical protein